MALWDPDTGPDFVRSAMVWNTMANEGALVDQVARKNAFLHSILGMADPNASAEERNQPWKKVKKCTGDRIEVRIHGAYNTPVIVARTAQADARTAALNTSWAYTAKFDLPLITNHHDLGVTEIDHYAGKEEKGDDFLQEVFDHLSGSMNNFLGTKMGLAPDNASAGKPSSSVIGSWAYAIAGDDPTGDAWTGGGDYGDLDRSDSGNADYRGYVYGPTAGTPGAVGDLTIPVLYDMTDEIATKQGKPRFGVSAKAVHGKIRELAQQYGHVERDPLWDAFGGSYVKIGGTVYALDHYAASGVLGIMDPETWEVWNKQIPMVNGRDVQLNPVTKASYLIPMRAYWQLICKQPNRNAYAFGINP